MSSPSEMRHSVANAIMAQVENPAQWLRALRVVAERLEVNPARCIPLVGDVTLEIACFRVLQEAEKQGRGADDVWDASQNIGVK